MKAKFVTVALCVATALAVPVVQPASASSTTALRRFEDPSFVDQDDSAALCHRFHLLPVGSALHTRALTVCEGLKAKMPDKFQDPPGSPTYQKNDYTAKFEKEKQDLIEAQKNRKPTPSEQAALELSNANQAKLDALKDSIAKNAAMRKADAEAADALANKDMADHQAAMQKQQEDRVKENQYNADKAAIEDMKRLDALDVANVNKAKQDWDELESSLADAKSNAASDPQVIKDQQDKINKLNDEREVDEAQRLADEAEAKRDQDLADSADKAARAKAREDRAKEIADRATKRQKPLEDAIAARNAARKRQALLDKEQAERARLQKEKDDADTALAANRKSREEEAANRQKSIDEFKKEEPDIKARREQHEKDEAARAERAKKRAEEEEARLKAKAEDDAKLAKAREDDVPPEEKRKRDDEDDCTGTDVSCGSGKCFQSKNDPSQKRCQCQQDVKGKNCEHEACVYDVDDGTGKTGKQKGNRVGQDCVRWKAEYRCDCGKAWRLDVECVKQDPKTRKEMRVPDRDCGSMEKPQNEYDQRFACSICWKCSPSPRELEDNSTTTTTVSPSAVPVDQTRALTPVTAVPVPVVAPTPLVVWCGSNTKRMVYTKDMYTPPDALLSSFKKGTMYEEVEVDSTMECEQECLDRNGVDATGDNQKPYEMSIKTHCTWVFYVESAKGTAGTVAAKDKCYLFYTGEFPDKFVPPTTTASTGTPAAKKQKVANTCGSVGCGVIGFVVYPRRWDLFREYKPGDVKAPITFKVASGLTEFKVYCGSMTAADQVEGRHTFAVTGGSVRDNACISTADTVLENAQAHAVKTMGMHNEVALPKEWTSYGTTSVRPPKTFKSKSTQIDWKYTVDRHFRVTHVSGITSELATGTRVDKEFEDEYNKLNVRPYMNKLWAPFCAGHLIAYQQKPANFYFNYVPQHHSSNGGGGCWNAAEESVASLIFLGCKVQYDVELDYGRNGDLESEKMFDELPNWARVKSSSVPTRRLATKTPVVSTWVPYKGTGLKCHYRFRPFAMNLDIELAGFKAGDHCENLFNGFPSGHTAKKKLFRVEWDAANSASVVVSSRIFAYLLAKKKPKKSTGNPTRAPSTKDLKRFLRLVTAMKKTHQNLKDLQCYAETGVIARFTRGQLEFDFHNAFLGSRDHTKCLNPGGANGCPKWTMTEKTTAHGVIETGDFCITKSNLDEAELSVRQNIPSSDCAEFVYNVDDLEFTLPEMGSLGFQIDELIIGTIVVGTSCLQDDMVTFADVDEGTCENFRISYYNFGKSAHTRELTQADETDPGSGDMEVDNDGQTCTTEELDCQCDAGDGEVEEEEEEEEDLATH